MQFKELQKKWGSEFAFLLPLEEILDQRLTTSSVRGTTGARIQST